MRRPIMNNSRGGAIVYDPFMGSGTTIIAAEMTGRCAVGLEILPPFCDVVIERWQEFTGKSAILDGDGREFAEVGAARKRRGKRASRQKQSSVDTASANQGPAE